MKKKSWFFEEEIDLKSGYCIDCQAKLKYIIQLIIITAQTQTEIVSKSVCIEILIY